MGILKKWSKKLTRIREAMEIEIEELEDIVNNLEKSAPGSKKLESLQDKLSNLQDAHDNLEGLENEWDD